MPETLNPRNDAVFKLLFADVRNRDLLISLLNAVLQPARPIVSVEVANPEIQKDAADDRGLILDIQAVHEDRTRTDVEMQSYALQSMPKRALYHWARLYRDGIGRGDDYRKLNACRVVFILAQEQLPGARFHSTFRALEVHDGTLLSDALEIHTVELPKLGKTRQIDPEDAAVHDWARFFAAETDQERKELAMRNQDIGKAKEALERLSQDPAARDLARWREDQIRLYEVELGMAHEAGREEGREEGREAGREAGREEGIRTAILSLCRAFGVPVTAEREAQLKELSTEKLSAMLDALATTRSWPTEH